MNLLAIVVSKPAAGDARGLGSEGDVTGPGAPGGVTAVICASDPVMHEAAFGSNFTSVVPARPLRVIVTVSPPAMLPLAGLIALTMREGVPTAGGLAERNAPSAKDRSWSTSS